MPVGRSPIGGRKYNLRSNPTSLRDLDDSGINTTARFESSPSISSETPPNLIDLDSSLDEDKSDVSSTSELNSTILNSGEKSNTFNYSIPVIPDNISINSQINDDNLEDNFELNINNDIFVEIPPVINHPNIPNFVEENIEMTAQTVSLKDALECVPIFDGKNISIHLFLEGCEEALLMLPAGTEGNLVKLIRMRLSGEARRVIQGQPFETLAALSKFLKSIYSPALSSNQIRRELGGAYQKHSEDTITYANRIREIGNRIIEAQKNDNDNELSPDQMTMINKEIVDSFLDGLLPELQLRIVEKYAKLDDAVPPVITIEKKLSAIVELRKGNSRTSDKIPPLQKVQTIQVEAIKCQICDKPGHKADICWQRSTVRQPPFNSTQTNNFSRNTPNFGPRDFAQTQNYHSNRYQNPNQYQHQNQDQYPNRYQNKNQNSDQYPNRYQNKNQYQNYTPSAPNNARSFNPNLSLLNTPRNQWQLNQNTPQDKFCNYCENPGHLREECRKLKYYNSLKTQENQNTNPGNSRSPPLTGAPRETTPAQRHTRLIDSVPIETEISES